MVSIVIPAFNEAASIAEVIDEMKGVLDTSGLMYEIIVVDDGSTDGTGAALEGCGVMVLRHPENRGYGASLKTGIRSANGDVVVITDADGTYPSVMIPGLVSDVKTGGYDMAVGSRTGADVNIPLVRRPAKWFLRQLANYLSETKIPDLNSGLRAFRKEIAYKYFHLLPQGFSFTTTITLAFLSDGYMVKYTPIDYRVRKGRSKIRPIRDFTNFFMLIIRISCYFNPLKIFLPASIICMLIGGAHVVETMIKYHRVTEAGLLAFLTGLQLGFIGLVTDVLVRRDRWVR